MVEETVDEGVVELDVNRVLKVFSWENATPVFKEIRKSGREERRDEVEPMWTRLSIAVFKTQVILPLSVLVYCSFFEWSFVW